MMVPEKLPKNNNKIKLLPKILAQQIAAGEVIERPASIIKELTENSIDAGADKIEIYIYSGGKDKIIIKDNGCGIAKQDLNLAVAQHATSKIYEMADLESITTLGFRGEALSSIAAVSKLEIFSKQKTSDLTWCYNNLTSEILATGELNNYTSGTKIIVRDLFFNLPARRKFLRSDRTEYLQIENFFKQLALSNFDIAFEFWVDDKLKFKLPITDSESRLAKLFGVRFNNKYCQRFELNNFDYKIHGWMVRSDKISVASEIQYYFVNQRMVKDKLIRHALSENLDLHENLDIILYLDFDPKQVDVNIHPTKQEVKFAEGRLVHDLISDIITNHKPNRPAKTNITPVKNNNKFKITIHNNNKIILSSYISDEICRKIQKLI